MKSTNNNQIGYLIKNINDKLEAKANADLKEHGLTLAQSRVLAILNERSDTNTTQKELEDLMRVSHPTMVGIISRMESGGFVVSYINPRDRRNKIVAMTEKAAAVGRNMADVIECHENELLKTLSDSERRELARMLRIVLGNLK